LPNKHYLKTISKGDFQNLSFHLLCFGAGKLFLDKKEKQWGGGETQQLFTLSFFSLVL